MAKPAANVTVTTEVGYCPFCRRTRTLRREERHLGALVRTNVDCESCHRTLSSTIGPAPEPAAPEPSPQPEPEPAPAPEVEPVAAAASTPKRPAAKKPTRKAAAAKAGAKKTED